MRAFNLVLITSLAAVWGYFLVAVAPLDASPPVAVKADGQELSAATLNNEGVRLDRQGRRGDALAHFERAQDFHPRDEVISRNVARARARVQKTGWARALGIGTILGVIWLGFSSIFRFSRYVRDAARLHRVRLRGDPWFHIRGDEAAAELPLRFSEPVDGLLKRHPLTVVWSSAAHGKHMKSKPPVAVEGRSAVIRLDETRLARLRRYPGDWKGFLYFGKTPVGEAFARVG